MRKPARCWSAILAVALLLPVASRARAAEASGSAWLGVYTQEITRELREGLDYNGQGAIVGRVVPDSPADRAGIERGDVIVKVGARVVRSPDELGAVVRGTAAGKVVAVEIVRDGRRKVVSATLAERPAAGIEGEEIAPEEPEAPEAPGVRKERRIKLQVEGKEYDFDLPHLSQLPHVSVPEIAPFVAMAGRGRLGVRVESLNPELASYFGSSDTRGALVLGVTDDSPAKKAGIRPGDVITRVGTHDVEDADDLVKAVQESEGEVSIALIRHNSSQSVAITLEPRREALRHLRDREGFSWKEKSGAADEPGAGEEEMRVRRRVVIEGDRLRDELRQEMDQLKRELKELRRELDSRKER